MQIDLLRNLVSQAAHGKHGEVLGSVDSRSAKMLLIVGSAGSKHKNAGKYENFGVPESAKMLRIFDILEVHEAQKHWIF